jgi:hypothetical protein
MDTAPLISRLVAWSIKGAHSKAAIHYCLHFITNPEYMPSGNLGAQCWTSNSQSEDIKIFQNVNRERQGTGNRRLCWCTESLLRPRETPFSREENTKNHTRHLRHFSERPRKGIGQNSMKNSFSLWESLSCFRLYATSCWPLMPNSTQQVYTDPTVPIHTFTLSTSRALVVHHLC